MHETRTQTIRDHNGDTVRIVWFPTTRNDTYNDLPPFPFQVYVTQSAPETAKTLQQPLANAQQENKDTRPLQTYASDGVPEAFTCWVQGELGGISDGNCRHHFQFYTKPQVNVLACVEHQQRELEHRRYRWPRMISRWRSDPHSGKTCSMIIVLDLDTWATHGFLFVTFDPESGPAMPNYSPNCDQPHVRAFRLQNLSELGGTGDLYQWWRQGGGEWMQERLQYANSGDLEPHWDSEDDAGEEHEVELPNITEADRMIGNYNQRLTASIAQWRDPTEPLIVNEFDGHPSLWGIDDSFHLESAGLRSKTFQDTTGLLTEAVWSGTHSKQPPEFSYTLYMDPGLPPYTSKAVFKSLNYGLLQHTPWQLYVIRDIPQMSQCLEHYRQEAHRRSRSRELARRDCMEMLVRKTAGHILPKELLMTIQEHLLPPVMHDFSSYPVQPFRNCFLLLNREGVYSGPRIVLTDPTPYRIMSDQPKNRWETTLHTASRSVEEVFYVFDLKFWHRTSDMLHILWTHCRGRPRSASSTKTIPTISLTIDLESYFPISHSTFPETSLRLTSHANQPLVIHKRDRLFTDFWESFIELHNLETGIQAPNLPYKLTHLPDRHQTWQPSAALALPNPDFLFLTLQPGETVDIGTGASPAWWWDMHGRGSLVQGRRYEIRLREGAGIERWTWGTSRDLEGPFDLPALGLRLAGDGVVRFGIEDGEGMV